MKKKPPTPPDSEPTTAVTEVFAPAPPKKTKRQKFTVECIHRARLVNAEYNPRIMDDYARARLEKLVKTHGLLAPITWNAKTGNIVGGHQRIAAIDSLEGTDDYMIDVAVVRLSEKEEREANLALNAQGAQGEFDVTKLGEMFKDSPGIGKLDIEKAGFDRIELEVHFAGTDFASMFSASEAASGALTQLAGIDSVVPSSSDGAVPTPMTDAVDEAAREMVEKATREAIAKQHRAEMKEHHKTNVNSDPEAYIVFVLKDRIECAAVARAFGEREDAKFIAGGKLLTRLGITIS